VTPEQLIERLKIFCPTGIRSVILYGSAAAGDYVEKRSDYNLLVVMERVGLEELRRFLSPSSEWVKAGNPPPLLLTLEEWRRSADVFAIEILDIKDSHRVLLGEDVSLEIRVDPENLRLQLEHELKGKLIQLRERYLETAGKSKRVMEVMVASLSSFLVLFRAALRLFQDQVPATKIEAVKQLSQHISFDPAVFELIESLKEGTKKIREVDPDAVFETYLMTVESIVNAIDAHLCRR
jgi:predicted nucleotidyltransferase